MVTYRGVTFDPGAMQKILDVGDKGDAVLALQKLLVSHGCADFGKIDGDFGQKTKAAVFWFQHQGNLAEDGVVGPATWAALIKDSKVVPVASQPVEPLLAKIRGIKNEKARQLLETAYRELGNREDPDGSNHGPTIDKYTQNTPEPWCADFVSWCIMQQAWNPLAKRQPSCTGFAKWGRTHGILFTLDEKSPEPGDLFIQLQSGEFGVDTGHSHIGFVADYDAAKKTVTSLEGNASNAVRSFTRGTKSITCYVRVVDFKS